VRPGDGEAIQTTRVRLHSLGSEMFGWVATQPLPQRLEELLARSGAVGRDWPERQPADALIFLPPDQVLSCGRLPHVGILTSYRMLLEASEALARQGMRAVLVNGDRLLGLSAEELVGWRTELPLPRPCTPQTPAPLEAALTAALLAAAPDLLDLYQALDERSERGGAEADGRYPQRLSTADPEMLVHTWNRQLERRQADIDLELLRLQLQDVEQECERQFLLARELAGKLSWYRRQQNQHGSELAGKLNWYRRQHQQALEQLERYGELVRRCLRLQARTL